jgi:hypothetical protein
LCCNLVFGYNYESNQDAKCRFNNIRRKSDLQSAHALAFDGVSRVCACIIVISNWAKFKVGNMVDLGRKE